MNISLFALKVSISISSHFLVPFLEELSISCRYYIHAPFFFCLSSFHTFYIFMCVISFILLILPCPKVCSVLTSLSAFFFLPKSTFKVKFRVNTVISHSKANGRECSALCYDLYTNPLLPLSFPATFRYTFSDFSVFVGRAEQRADPQRGAAVRTALCCNGKLAPTVTAPAARCYYVMARWR